jgi:hypothetical protein
MGREEEALHIDEAWLRERRAEIDAARQTPPPGPDATEEERQAYATVTTFVKEAAEALAGVEAALRQRRIEESKRRQQQVQWEVVRLRLRKSVSRQSDDRRQQNNALMRRVLPSDKGLTQRLGESEWSDQRRFLSGAIDNFRSGMQMLPPEEIMAESRILLDFFSVLQPPRAQDPAQEQRAHMLLSEQARDLRNWSMQAEKQQPMHTMAQHALGAAVVGDDEN